MVDRFVVIARIAKIREYLEIDRRRVYRALTTDLTSAIRSAEPLLRNVSRKHLPPRTASR